MKLLICQSCGVVIRSRGKHCTGCGIQLALNSPTQMPSFSQIQMRPPLAVSVKQDHLLLERVVTERQLNVLTLRPRHVESALVDDGHDSYASPGGPSYGSYDNGGNGGNGHGNGNGGNGHGNGNGGNGYGHDSPSSYSKFDDEPASASESNGSAASPSTPWSTSTPVDPQSSNGFGWNNGPQAQIQPQSDPGTGGGFFSAGPSNNIYLKPTTETLSEISESTTLIEDSDPSTQAFGGFSLEDSSASLPVQTDLQNEFAVNKSSDEEPSPVAEPANKVEEPPPVVQKVAPSVASLSTQAGAAISIAIGGGVAGMMASQMLSRTSAPKEEPVSTASAAPAETTNEAPQQEELIPSSLAESGDPDDFFAATPAGGSTSESAGSESRDSVSSSSDSEPASASASAPATSMETEPAPSAVQQEPAQQAPTGTTSGTETEVLKTSAPEPLAEASQSAPGADADEFFQQKAKSDVDDFFGTSGRSAEPRKESNSFFGDDGGFDFFSSPVDAASRKAASFAEEEPPRNDNNVVEPPKSEIKTPAPASSPETSVEPEMQERPKVAMPKSITQSRTRLKQVEEEEKSKQPSDDDEDSDCDDEEQNAYKPPKRRNFSGGSNDVPKVSKGKGKSSAKKKVVDDDDDDDDDDKETGSGAGGALTWLEEEVSLGGMTVSRKTAGVLIAVGLFIIIQVPGWMFTFGKALVGSGQQQAQTAIANRPAPGGSGFPGSAPGGMQGGQPGGMSGGFPGGFPTGAPTAMQQPGMPGVPGGVPPQGAPGTVPGAQPQSQWTGPIPTVAGQWNIQVRGGGKVFAGVMQLQQQGSQFAGRGGDEAGHFEVAGSVLPPDQLQFTKRYDSESRKNGAHKFPFTFQGKLLPQKNGTLATVGKYRTEKQQGSSFGYLNKLRMIPITDDFTAQQTQIAVAQAPPVINVPQPHSVGGFGNPIADWLKPKQGGASGSVTGREPEYVAAQRFFLVIAGGLIVVGILIFLFFLHIFGPAGAMNVWEKEKYIPSQFRGEHMKMVREMGKPLKSGGVPFGTRREWHWWCFWTPKYLSLTPEQRRNNPHMLIIGGGDKGKTRLMASMVTHDIKSEDRAIVLIDSDGQLSDLVIEWIASQSDGSKYAKRVVLVDPTYKAGSLAYNPLEVPEDGDLQAAASAIVHGFKAIYTEPPGAQSQWNAQTANILRNAALLLIANGRTLTDLPNLLQDNDFRDIMLEAVERKKEHKTEYITILETWNQYKKLARTDQWINWVEPILNRVGPMLSDGRIRPILTKPVSDLKLKDIIRKKKILIVKVPQGELDQNANLLGSLIVTGLQQAAMSLCREEGPNNERERPVALYLDEMDSFIEKESIENITSETKRYQMGFVATIKTLQHLPEDYRNQLIINMGTMAVFAIAKKDGDMLGPQMFRVDGRKIKHQTIQNFFNKVNTTPQFELIMDEEKLNIDRIVGQNEQTYFCYRVGTVAGVFQLKAYDFKDIPEKKINRKLVEKMHAITDSFGSEKKKSKDKDKDKEDRD